MAHIPFVQTKALPFILVPSKADICLAESHVQPTVTGVHFIEDFPTTHSSVAHQTPTIWIQKGNDQCVLTYSHIHSAELHARSTYSHAC